MWYQENQLGCAMGATGDDAGSAGVSPGTRGFRNKVVWDGAGKYPTRYPGSTRLCREGIAVPELATSHGFHHPP